jgi:hypothetical protein
MDDKKQKKKKKKKDESGGSGRTVIGVVAIVLCFAGAVVAYIKLSAEPAPAPKNQAAEVRASEIQRSMEVDQAKQPKPPPPPPVAEGVHRGAVAPPTK